ncbi:MAG: hypothetical protein H0U65_16665 [Rubrobacter sp.]|jgi:hypothetical protein|nr:hypothetical protein [Rubrobacter sp.]
MSEERRRTHSEEPAEGGEEKVESPGAGKSENRDSNGEEKSPEHSEEPAEGGEDEVEEPGVDKPENS